MPEYNTEVDFGAAGTHDVEVDVDYDWMWEYIIDDIDSSTMIQWIDDHSLLPDVVRDSEADDVLDALNKDDILKYVAKMLDIEEAT